MGIGMRPKALAVAAGVSALVSLVPATMGLASSPVRSLAGASAVNGAGAGKLIQIYKGSGGSATPNQSNNWSGYNQGLLEKGKTFHAITADWVVPTASPQKRGEQEFSASWTGIGGGCVDAGCLVTDNTLIQAGTEQDIAATNCSVTGIGCPLAAQYSAWFELIPAPSVTVPLTVTAGNHVHVDIHETVTNSEVWSITIQNVSTGQTYQVTVPYTSSYATAEWIEETPIVCCPPQVGPLPKLGKVTFDPGTVNGSNPALVASEEIQLVDFTGHVLATPSAPDSERDGFGDCTYASSCSAPSS